MKAFVCARLGVVRHESDTRPSAPLQWSSLPLASSTRQRSELVVFTSRFCFLRASKLQGGAHACLLPARYLCCLQLLNQASSWRSLGLHKSAYHSPLRKTFRAVYQAYY